ncbi:UDP-N-acetylglucosamine 2-epimerase [Streptomyces sp. SCSIO 30461]|uniref:UDP-N-acetylglucosamine 2-epimerase n=1 Tax=Streptomyces sp. SCSIO 30461 TaxID=3118085 RepID=UPI00387E87D8
MRSPDRTPEEANRRIVTACTDHHLATTAEAVAALRGEGVPTECVHFVGNPMAEGPVSAVAWRSQRTLTTEAESAERSAVTKSGLPSPLRSPAATP